MSKKVIEQEKWGDMVVLQNMNFDNKKLCVVIRDYTRMDALRGEATILDENRTTVAKAICPEYQKVIDQNVNLQSDLSAWENRAKEAEQRNANLVGYIESAIGNLEIEHSFDALQDLRQALQNNKKIEG